MRGLTWGLRRPQRVAKRRCVPLSVTFTGWHETHTRIFILCCISCSVNLASGKEKPMRILNCQVCGKPFTVASKKRLGTAKYCSMACYNTVRNHKVCTVEGCEGKAIVRGLCDNHYRRLKRQTDKENQAGRRLSEKKWKANHKPRVRAYQREDNRRPQTRFRKAQWTAGRRGIVWELTWEQFASFLGQPCHYCGCEISGGGAGLDRKDSASGYTTENVLPCCRECNRVKSHNYTVGETEVMIEALLRYRREHGQYIQPTSSREPAAS